MDMFNTVLFFINLHVYILQHHAPRIYVDGGAKPVEVVVYKEDEAVVVLSVEIFLVGHLLVVVALNQQGIVDKRNTEHHLLVKIVVHL